MYPAAVDEVGRYPLPGGLDPLDPDTVARAATLLKEPPPSGWAPWMIAAMGTLLPAADLALLATGTHTFRAYAYLVTTTAVAIGCWRAPIRWWKLRKARHIAMAVVTTYLHCLHITVGPQHAEAAEAQWRHEYGL